MDQPDPSPKKRLKVQKPASSLQIFEAADRGMCCPGDGGETSWWINFELCPNIYFFLPPLSSSPFRSQLTTFPSITTPLPSMKATRDRPSQCSLNYSYTKIKMKSCRQTSSHTPQQLLVCSSHNSTTDHSSRRVEEVGFGSLTFVPSKEPQGALLAEPTEWPTWFAGAWICQATLHPIGKGLVKLAA